MQSHPFCSTSTTTDQPQPIGAGKPRFLALILPMAITAACSSGFQKQPIIDYTIAANELPSEQPIETFQQEPVISAANDVTAMELAMALEKESMLLEPSMGAAMEKPSMETMAPAPLAANELPALTQAANAQTAAAQEALAQAEAAQTALAEAATAQAAEAQTALEQAAAAQAALAQATVAHTTAPTPELPELSSITATPLAANENTMAAEPAIGAALEVPLLSNLPAPVSSLRFKPAVYATAGLGISHLNPNTSAVAGFELNDPVAPSGQIAIGVDIAKRLSLELHSADYGSASLSPEGRINYHMNGVSALFYAGKDRYRRQGWNAFARLGYNQLENTPVGNVPFIRQTSQHASFGLGAEYNTRWGIGLRADAIAFDGDVQYGQLGMLYRMGPKPKQTKPQLAALDTDSNTAAPVLAAAMAEKTTAPATSVYKPSGFDTPEFAEPAIGQANSQPKDIVYKTTYAGGTDACTTINGTLNNVNFHTGSATLTSAAAVALIRIADTLKSCEHRQVTVSAHTDNQGSAHANSNLSKERAREVAIFLGRRGIAMNRLNAVAFGESRPIASNNTSEGRSLNRRVEMTVE